MFVRDLFPITNPADEERCGVILNTGEVVELKNHSLEPMKAFAMDDEEITAENVIATWHTHPRTGPNLSCDDYHAFKAYPKLKHLIIAGATIWVFEMVSDILCLHEDDHFSWLPQGPST